MDLQYCQYLFSSLPFLCAIFEKLATAVVSNIFRSFPCAACIDIFFSSIVIFLQSACWAMAKSWLDVQVDLELAQSKPGLTERFKSCLDESPETLQNGSQASLGPEDWPLHVLNQQPRDLPALLQKLHSGYACNYWNFSFCPPC